MQSKSLWFKNQFHAVMETEMLPVLPPNKKKNSCLIKTLFTAISPGTEYLVYSGGVPKKLYVEMRCPYMGGDFSFPIKYGYSLVGQVLDGPTSLKGKLIHTLHPHQDYARISAEDVYVIPDGISPQRATLASNMETALNAIWDSGVNIGDKVLIVGFGIIGSLIARILSFIPQVEVDVLDVQPAKITLIEQLGFSIYKEEKEKKYDLAFHTSGSGPGLQTSINNVGLEGKIIETSWYGDKEVNLCLGETFHSQRKLIISSQVSHLPACKSARWDYKRRKEVVFQLLLHPEFDAHITHTIAFHNLPKLFQSLKKNRCQELSYLVYYPF